MIAGFKTSLETFRPHVLMETGSEEAVAAGGTLCGMGYKVFVSERPGDLYQVTKRIEDALARSKDVLFVHTDSIRSFLSPGQYE